MVLSTAQKTGLILDEFITYMIKQRITWEQYAINIAKEAAARSEDPFRKVGACALNHENKVIGVAYNGLVSNFDPPPTFWSDRDFRRKYMVHAEVNLLSLFRRDECKVVACTLLPCTACACMIACYGVKKVVYQELYERDCSAFEIFNFYNIELEQIN
jgi:dCMP deaminase